MKGLLQLAGIILGVTAITWMLIAEAERADRQGPPPCSSYANDRLDTVPLRCVPGYRP